MKKYAGRWQRANNRDVGDSSLHSHQYNALAFRTGPDHIPSFALQFPQSVATHDRQVFYLDTGGRQQEVAIDAGIQCFAVGGYVRSGGRQGAANSWSVCAPAYGLPLTRGARRIDLSRMSAFQLSFCLDGSKTCGVKRAVSAHPSSSEAARRPSDEYASPVAVPCMETRRT